LTRSLKTTIALVILFTQISMVHAQQQAPAAPAPNDPTKDVTKGPSLLIGARSVNNSVGVSATLLTYPAVRRIFGKEIADTYAVAQLTVSNRNPDAAFVLHSAYLDLTDWAFGGHREPIKPHDLKDYQAGTRPNEIASVEARLARGQLIDAQMWSRRNWTMRLLTLAGAVAGSVVFDVGETGAKYIAAINGTMIPGVAVAWPDGTVNQLNRISDFGFQTNKVFPKESADIIVCFFPMDLFLSPGLKQIFQDTPALFLSPRQILFTEGNQKARATLGVKTEWVEPAKRLMMCPDQPCRDAFAKAEGGKDVEKFLSFIDSFGANRITAVVDGVMTVEVDSIPAAIDDIKFDGDATKQSFWAPGDHKAALLCRYCAGGQVSIDEAATLGITDVKVQSDQLDEHQLTFSYKLTKPIDIGTVLHFVVTKPSADPKKAKGIESTHWAAPPVQYQPVGPKVNSVAVDNDNKKITLTGSSLDSTASHPITVALSREGGQSSDKSVNWPADARSDNAVLAAPTGLIPGCWDVKMTWANQSIDVPHAQKSERLLVAPSPTLTDAKRNGTMSITVTGSQFVDTSACADSSIGFELVNQDKPNDMPLAVTTTLDPKDATKATLTLPMEARTGNWLVRIVKMTITTPLK
jgi:hypothetical protein